MTSVQTTPNTLEVRNPFTSELVGTLPMSSTADIQVLADVLPDAVRRMGAMTRRERSDLLNATANKVEAKAAHYADLICRESGKPISQATHEVARCCNTLRLSASEALALYGETVPFDAYPGNRNRTGYFNHVPLGSILAITPFNDPLNLVAHKLGPAIAAGNAVVLKPSERTPFVAKELVEDFRDAGLPLHGIELLNGGPDIVAQALEEIAFRMVTFTGGMHAAEAIVQAGGVKRYAMDLGGNAGVIVLDDADWEWAAADCVAGAFGAQGQNCIGVQRIFVHERVFESFLGVFTEQTKALKLGDPSQPDTDIGPMINRAAAKRISTWIEEAVSAGATVLCGGQIDGNIVAPTVLTDVAQTCKIWSSEAFAPVVIVQKVSSLDEAIVLANNSEVSLHAAIYTSDVASALEAADRLEASGVMINESSDYRFDGMPFGGFKLGSMGREGVKFAVEEMTQTKLICFSRPLAKSNSKRLA